MIRVADFRHRLSGRRTLIVALVVVAALVVAAGLTFGHPWHSGAEIHAHRQEQRAAAAAVVALPAPDLLRALTPEEAIAANSKRAAVARPDNPAAAFKGKFANDDSRGRALDCLTQAVYYEAASEPLAGRAAVAQVVLNRLRHAGFPATVCGVVYQGSERTTGCQFTFACDGSLRRTPASSLWDQARKVAAQALAGRVFAPVGHATHYHADYVLPYWADSLDKEVQIGRHIFYRLRGGPGARGAFNQAYHGKEPAPLTPTDVQVAASAIESAVTPVGDEVNAILAGKTVPPKPDPITADLTHGQLLLDEDRSVAALSKPAAVVASDATPCAASRSVKAAPLDNRSSRSLAATCP